MIIDEVLMRCFVAIKLDEQIQNRLGRFQSRLQMDARLGAHGIKWMKPELIHLTLKFLGEVEDYRLMDVCNVVSATAGRFDPFDFEIGGCGCFPSDGAARVIWTGTTENVNELRSLHEALDIELGGAGFDREVRAYSPHLTLARIKDPKKGRSVAAAIKEVKDFDVGVQGVNTITIFESVLGRGGPDYHIIHHAELGKQ